MPFLAQEVVGKPKGQVWVGPHSDVYSLGKLSAFALTGKADPESARQGAAFHAGFGQRLADGLRRHGLRPPRLAHVGLVLEQLERPVRSRRPHGSRERTLYGGHRRSERPLEHAPGDDVTVLCNRANAQFRQGEFALAVADYSQAIELRPQDASLRRRRALAHVRARNLEDAITDYTESLTLGPRDVKGGTQPAAALAYAQLELGGGDR